MRVVIGITLTVLLAALVVMLIAWLSSRASRMARVAGALLSGVVTIYCLIYVVALTMESGGRFNATVLFLVILFALTAVGAVYAAFRSLRPRVRPRSTF